MSLLEIKDLRVSFTVRGRWAAATELRAVDGVSLRLEEGESVGLVGESGCGKTTLGLAALGLIGIGGGRIRFRGADIGALKGGDLTRFRRDAQMIFQDPLGSLNPRMSVYAAISEVLAIHGLAERHQRRQRVGELLSLVGLDPAYMNRYPHEFSGGQRQRIGIARALAVNPSLIVADEPVSALDVSVQIQILNLMQDLQQRLRLSYLFIAHDLAVVRYMCERMLVMYLGKVVEQGTAREILERPAHPYSQALLSAVPDVRQQRYGRGGRSGRIILKGDAASATRVPPGCPFHPRCQRAQPVCRTAIPEETMLSPEHMSRCHFAAEVARESETGAAERQKAG